jgi:hypothetical protein
MTDVPPDPLPLDQVIDDYAPRQEAIEWATGELTDGQSFEEVHRHLTESGWSEADASQIVEEARGLTRHVRGALTRDQVMRTTNQRYRQGMMGGWFVGLPSIAAVRRLMHSLASLSFLRRHRPR